MVSIQENPRSFRYLEENVRKAHSHLLDSEKVVLRDSVEGWEQFGPFDRVLVLSRDAGKSWELERELVVFQTAASADRGKLSYAEYWDDMGRWSFGHPSGIALDDDTLLLVYYAGEDPSCLSICWARIEV